MSVHISVQDVEKSFGAFKALNCINLSIQRGEFLTLLGPSGSGKTTLLMMLAGFETPTRGEIHKAGANITNVTPDRRNFGMVFQGYALFPHLTVAENIDFPLRVRRMPAAERRMRVDRMIDMMGLSQHADKRPSRLSGGQQQRVALARALVFEPELLLLDEPLSALDKNLREQLQFELKEVHRKTGTTFVFVTHDQNEALALSDRIAIFETGRIAQIDTPKNIYSNPHNRFTAEFLGSINIFPLHSTQIQEGIVSGKFCGELLSALLGSDLPTTGEVLLGVRPEYLDIECEEVTAGDNRIKAVLTEKVYQGSNTVLKFMVANGQEVIAICSNAREQKEPEIQQSVWITWPRVRGRIISEDQK